MGILDFFKKETKTSEKVTSSDDEQMMFTPDVVNSLADNEVFVFGSNLRALIYTNPFGEINEVDRAFGELTFEEILNEIEKLS